MKVREEEVEHTAEHLSSQHLHPDPKTTLLRTHSVLPNPRPETHSRQGHRQRGDCSNPPHHLVTAHLRAPIHPHPRLLFQNFLNIFSLNSSFPHSGSTYNACSVLFCFIPGVSHGQWTAVLQKGFGNKDPAQSCPLMLCYYFAISWPAVLKWFMKICRSLYRPAFYPNTWGAKVYC